MASPTIRIADDPAAFVTAEEIESAADRVLKEHVRAEEWPQVTPSAERAIMPGFLLVIEESPGGLIVGFAHVIEIDGFIHLEQLAVSPEHARRGYGRMLVDAALAEGALRRYQEMTLRTYLNVPFNAPFYETCGFDRSEPSAPFHARLVDIENGLGLNRYGERIQMTARLPESTDVLDDRSRS